MSQVRKITARNMVHSWQTIPHVNQFDKSDITELEQFRKQYGKSAEKAGGKLTITAILLKVTAAALKKFPKFNASLDMQNQEIIYKRYIHIGVAVDTDRGLLVPVIRGVDQKSLLDLAVELTAVAQKARDKKLTPDDLQGGNFSISNLGGIGGTNFTPIVYPPQVAVLGIAWASTEAIFIDGEFKPRLILPLSVSYDHRIIDGAEGARFLRWICAVLENPYTLLFEGGL
jgi:pyruvate dehydrogenase E2 component (dihydrolipoamide acetyltransferase)